MFNNERMEWYELIQRKMQRLGPYWNEGYREFCVAYLAASDINIAGRHTYLFGIDDGSHLRQIYQMFRYYHLTPESILVFDSFEGFTKKKIKRFLYSLPDVGIPIEHLPIDWHKWDFDEPMTPEFMNVNPKSAFWIDVDVDTYMHALHILDFMFQNRLITAQTLISFCDWGQHDGPGLAWHEMCQKYAVEAKEILSYQLGAQGTSDLQCSKVVMVEQIA